MLKQTTYNDAAENSISWIFSHDGLPAIQHMINIFKVISQRSEIRCMSEQTMHPLMQYKSDKKYITRQRIRISEWLLYLRYAFVLLEINKLYKCVQENN